MACPPARLAPVSSGGLARGLTPMKGGGLALGILLLVGSRAGADGAVDHGAWDRALKRSVRDGLVDYQALQADRAELDGYLTQLATVRADALPSREEQLAFWINAYNAAVVTGVLDHGPPRSVKAVDGFFDRVRYQLGGAARTLNEIEAAGRAVGDWRIHFALVCASSSCPALIRDAYVPERLEAQLTERTKAFLADAQRGLRIEGSTLWASKIFQWYQHDFVPGPLRAQQLLEVLELYLPETIRQEAAGRRLGLKFLDYDWTLNAAGGPRDAP